MPNYQEHNGTSYHAETSLAVINALENCRRNGTRVPDAKRATIAGMMLGDYFDA